MIRYKLKPLVAAIAVISAPVFAQDEPVGLEEVVVTGFRSSLANALDKKRTATGFVDAIVAEDIADFPDNNLAESLQRIPGVAISRAAGEGRNISVRGLGPDFTRVRINGMEAIATSGGTDAIGGANRGRGFDFNTFSSDLFNSLTVRKTASADVEEGSLGATVDLQAARPFDFNEMVLVANAQMGYNDLSEESNPKMSFLVSNVFGDSIGALLSVSYSERDIADLGASTVRWNFTNPIGTIDGEPISIEDPGNPGTMIPNPDYPSDVNAASRPRIPRYDSYNHEISRLGVSGSLQFQPSDVTDISLDVLHSQHDGNRREVFMQGILNAGSYNAGTNVCSGISCSTVLESYVIDNTNTMVAADFSNATLRSEHRYDELTTDFTQVTLSADHEFSDNFRIKALIGSAESEFDNPIQTTIVMQKSGMDFSYDYSGSYRTNPQLTFGDDSSSDPLQQLNAINGWTSNSVRLRPLGATNTFDVAELNLEFDLSDSVILKGGIHQKMFEFETVEARRSSENNAGIVIDANNTMLYSSGIGPQGQWLVPNIDAIAEQYNIYSNEGVFAVSTDNRRPDNYSAEEDTMGVWAQVAWDTTIGDVPARGDFGFRYVDTDQSSTAWANIGGTEELITAKHSYDEVLPSLNMVFEPIEDVLIRVGYAEVMARAGLQNIRPNVSVSVSGTNRTINGGNPTLEPTRAKTYDIGMEVYFENEGGFSAAVFRKEIDSFVQTLRETKLFTETGLPIQAAVDACEAALGYGPGVCDENMEWNTSTPLNGPGGDLYGFETSYQQPFTFLPGFWQNFGIIANYTYVKAQLDYVNQDGAVLATRNLQDLSESTRSATLYYENESFGARISTVTRSEYLTNAIGRDNNDMEGTNPTTNVDASVFYNVNDNFKVSFEALNLTDEADDQWVDSAGNRLSYYHETGTQYYLGIQYKY